jgi:DNA mismatch repair protein MutS2
VGVLLENPVGKKRVKIRMGEKEVSVSVSVLAGLPAGDGQEEAATSRAEQSAGARRPVSTGSGEASTAVDVRGRTAEDAREALVACLDQALLDGVSVVRIIHGHGTGRLKQVLRDYLKDSPYVSAFRPGERPEGGDGVTVVKLK